VTNHGGLPHHIDRATVRGEGSDARPFG